MPPPTGAVPPGRRELPPPAKLSGKHPADALRVQDQINLDVFLASGGSPVPHGATHGTTGADPLPTPLTIPLTVKAGITPSIGEGPSYMREDAQLAAETSTPVNIGMTNAEGSGTPLARASHVHATPLTTNGDLLTVIAGVLARLGIGAAPNGYVLTLTAGLPAWAASGSAPPPDTAANIDAARAFLSHPPRVRQVRAGSNITVTEDALGYIVAGSAGGAVDSGDNILAGQVFGA